MLEAHWHAHSCHGERRRPCPAGHCHLDHLEAEGCGGGVTIPEDYLKRMKTQLLLVGTHKWTSYRPGEIGRAHWGELPRRVLQIDPVLREVFGLVMTLL